MLSVVLHKNSIEVFAMENSKKKKNDTIENLPFWRRYYPLIGAILIVASLFLYILVIIINDPIIIYPVFTSFNGFSMVIICLIIPAFSLVFFRGLIRLNTLISRREILVFSSLTIVGIGAYIYIALLLSFSDTYTHKDGLRLDNQLYYLVAYKDWEMSELGRFIIYRCDNMSIFCSRTFILPYHYHVSLPAELDYDPESREILIIFDGEFIKTYQLDN